MQHYILILISLDGENGYEERLNLVYETIMIKWRDSLFLIFWKKVLTSISYFFSPALRYTDWRCFIQTLYKIDQEIKVGLSPSKKNFYFCFNDSPSKMIKNAFYFILKAYFVLKIFKFLSWVFGQVALHKKWSFPLRIWSHLLKKSLIENFIFVQCWLIIVKMT